VSISVLLAAVEQTKSYMCQAAPVLFAKNLSLSLSLCLCLCLCPGRVDDVYVLSPGPALSTHEFERRMSSKEFFFPRARVIQQLTTAAASRFQLRSVEPSSRATFTLLSKICLVFALKE
jgi:hypothetical protein